MVKKTLKHGGFIRTLKHHIKKSKRYSRKGIIIGKLSSNTRNSEVDLIDKYTKFTKSKRLYLEAYQEHRLNLKSLDAKLGSGASFLKFFDEIIMPNDILSGDPIDTKNPLLINDYFIYNDSTIKDLKMEHIKQQIRYIYYTKFNRQMLRLIKSFVVKDISPTLVKLEFVGSNNKQYFRDCPIDKFILDEPTIVEIIPDISTKIKSNISEFVSEPDKLAAKRKQEAEEKLAKEIELAKAAEEALKLHQQQQDFRRPPRDFGAAAAAAVAITSPAIVKTPGEASEAAPSGIPAPSGLPKIDISGAPSDSSLLALINKYEDSTEQQPKK
jgi:hypothetical protein